MKADGHPALALVDLQTQGGDLIDSKFVHLYYIPTRPSEKKTLSTAIKGSQGTIDKECTIQLDWIGYLEGRSFYVAHLSGWNMILEEPSLSAANVQISASKEPVTIQPPNMQRFPLTVWQKPRTQARLRSATIKITCEKVTDYSNEDEVAIVIASSKVAKQFNSVKEFPNLFPKTIPTELPPLRKVNHRINLKPGSEWLSTWRPSAHKFGQHINDKFNAEIKSAYMYRAPNDKNAVVMFCIAKRDQPDKARFVTDCRLRNLGVYKKQTPLPNIGKLIELVATYPVWSKIDLADGYFNMRVEESSQKCNTLVTTQSKIRS